jgi:hypothetical protein
MGDQMTGHCLEGPYLKDSPLIRGGIHFILKRPGRWGYYGISYSPIPLAKRKGGKIARQTRLIRKLLAFFDNGCNINDGQLLILAEMFTDFRHHFLMYSFIGH